jgi:hypothetical protein
MLRRFAIILPVAHVAFSILPVALEVAAVPVEELVPIYRTTSEIGEGNSGRVIYEN